MKKTLIVSSIALNLCFTLAMQAQEPKKHNSEEVLKKLQAIDHLENAPFWQRATSIRASILNPLAGLDAQIDLRTSAEFIEATLFLNEKMTEMTGLAHTLAQKANLHCQIESVKPSEKMEAITDFLKRQHDFYTEQLASLKSYIEVTKNQLKEKIAQNKAAQEANVAAAGEGLPAGNGLGNIDNAKMRQEELESMNADTQFYRQVIAAHPEEAAVGLEYLDSGFMQALRKKYPTKSETPAAAAGAGAGAKSVAEPK